MVGLHGHTQSLWAACAQRLHGRWGRPCGQELSAVVATRRGLRGAAATDVSYLITQELTTQSRRQLVSCKYVNTGKRCCNARCCRADKHPWSRGGGESPGYPRAGRCAARNPNEKWLPNEINQAGGVGCDCGEPCGRAVVCPAGGWQRVRLSKGGRGKMVMPKSVRSAQVGRSGGPPEASFRMQIKIKADCKCTRCAFAAWWAFCQLSHHPGCSNPPVSLLS